MTVAALSVSVVWGFDEKGFCGCGRHLLYRNSHGHRGALVCGGCRLHQYHCRSLNVSSAVFILVSADAEGRARVRMEVLESLPQFSRWLWGM